MPDQTTGRQLGTERYLGTVGRVNRLGTVAQVGYVPRVGTIGRLGTLAALGYVPRVGTIGRLGTVAQVSYAPRVGTVGRLGTVAQVTYIPRMGSQGYQTRLGTLARAGTVSYVGTVGRIVAGSITIAQRNWAGSVIWDRRHTARGSTYVGSWQYIAQRAVKTYQVRSSSSGTLFIITGATGTGVANVTGTYSSQRLGQGTLNSFSFTEVPAYTRPIVFVGSVGSGKGTLSVALMRQG